MVRNVNKQLALQLGDRRWASQEEKEEERRRKEIQKMLKQHVWTKIRDLLDNGVCQMDWETTQLVPAKS